MVDGFKSYRQIAEELQLQEILTTEQKKIIRAWQDCKIDTNKACAMLSITEEGFMNLVNAYNDRLAKIFANGVQNG